MGDTALIRGVASAARHLKPSTSTVGVVAARAPAYLLSWQQRRAVETESADTMADGLAVRRALAPNVSAICELLDDVRTVSEEELLAAIAHLLVHERGASGGGTDGGVSQDTNPAPTSVLLVTGCNIPPEILSRVRPSAT